LLKVFLNFQRRKLLRGFYFTGKWLFYTALKLLGLSFRGFAGTRRFVLLVGNFTGLDRKCCCWAFP